MTQSENIDDENCLELRPEFLAVVTESNTGNSFPRPKDWRPSAGLRLHVKPSDTELASWRFVAPAQSANAATAEVRYGTLDRPDGQKPAPIVVKFVQEEPAQNTLPSAIQARFNREQQVLVDLERALPPALRETIPTSWNPSGQPRRSTEALRLELPVVFCLAAQHAIPIQTNSDEPLPTLHAKLNELLSQSIGQCESACRGCANYDVIMPRPATDAGDEIPTQCRPWLVSNGANSLISLVVKPSRTLILTLCGESVQSRLDRVEGYGLGKLISDVPLAIQQLSSLATSLAAIHRTGWLHLDINFDNICEDAKQQWRLIDFGHAEPRLQTTESVVSQRIPLRRLDFAAPEMQMRTVSMAAIAINSQSLRLIGHVGWPISWLPRVGDRLSLAHEPEVRYTILEVNHNRESERDCVLTLAKPLPAISRETVTFTLYRTPGPATDLYSFGLVLLCRLFQIQKPIDLREELAVFERALHRCTINRGLERPLLTAANWLNTYRRMYERTSELLGRYYPEWEARTRKYSSGDRDKLKWALQQLLAIGLRCVLRYREWTFASSDPNPTALPFDAVAAELASVGHNWWNGKDFPVLDEPISINDFIIWLDHALPVKLTPIEAQSISSELLETQIVLTELLAQSDEVQAFSSLRQKLWDALVDIDADMDRWEDQYQRSKARSKSSFLGRILRSFLPWSSRGRTTRDPQIDNLLLLLEQFSQMYDPKAQDPFGAILRRFQRFTSDRTLCRKAIAQAGQRFGEWNLIQETIAYWISIRKEIEKQLESLPIGRSLPTRKLTATANTLIHRLNLLHSVLSSAHTAFQQRSTAASGRIKEKKALLLSEYRDLATANTRQRIVEVREFLKRLIQLQNQIQSTSNKLMKAVNLRGWILPDDARKYANRTMPLLETLAQVALKEN